jgi:three-Cys-motif partner protein
MTSEKYSWKVGDTPPLLEAHSLAKHAVLRTYVRRYIEVLTSNPRRDSLNLTLIDGFAGGGEYLYQGTVSPGSPMILLEEIAGAQARFDTERTKPFHLNADFVFVEVSKPNLDFLEHTIRASGHKRLLDDSVHLLNQSFEDALPSIISRIQARSRADRCIFFLDQYGYNQVSFDAIRMILTSLQNPEIIVTFSVDSLIDYLTEDEAFLKGIKPVELSLDDVHNMLALKEQREARWLIQNLLYRHLRDKTAAPYYTCFFIKSPASHRSYWLVHISKHPKARDEMALRHWAMSNHFVHHGRAGVRMLGFDPEKDINQIPMDFLFDDNADMRSKAALMTELPPLIFGSTAGTAGPPTLGSLFSQICNETPATTHQISDVLVRLRNEREIEILSEDRRPKPRSLQIGWSDLILPARQRSMFSTIWPPQLK